MNIPCPYNAPCIDDQSSFGNFSSEAPDRYLFHSVYYKNMIWDGDWPIWYACLGLCSSSVSQADADICAHNNAMACERSHQYLNYQTTAFQRCGDGSIQSYTVPAGLFLSFTAAQSRALAYQFASQLAQIYCGGTYNGAPPLVSYPQLPTTSPEAKTTNTPQQCTVDCPTGGTFTYVVPAGWCYGANQADANARAKYEACRVAILGTPSCFNDLPRGFCLGDEVNSHVLLSNPGPAPIVWSMTGSLPPGLSFTYADDLAVLAGIPTAGGNFVFTLMATDAQGSFTIRTYQIKVLEITSPANLPSGIEDEAYTYTLTVMSDSYIPPLSFQLKPGSSLPPGLTLDEGSGTISGTPTADITYSFIIVVQDEAS